MSELVEFRTGANGVVLVEVAETVTDQVRRGRPTRDSVIEAGRNLESVVGQIGPVISGMVSELRTSADWPDEVEIEFSVKISADSNVIIARAGGEANFRVALRWTDRGVD